MAVYGSTRYAPTSYRHAKCAACGKEFACPMGTRYKKGSGDDERYFCSYTCFRTVDKAEEERAKKAFDRECKKYDAYLAKRALDNQRAYANKRLKHCQDQVKIHMEERKKHKKGTPEYERAQRLLTVWRNRRSEAIKAVRELY